MPGSVRVSGTWRSITRPSIRVSGTWRNVSQAWVRVGGSWVVWFLSTITDAFNRANTTTSLGNADTGQAWTNVRDTWFVSSNQARSDGAASSYPLASVPLNSQNSTTSATVTNGVGPAFWITDSNNWWASHGHTTSSTSTTCGGGATGNIFTSPQSCACGSQTSGMACGGGATGWSTSDPGTCACGSRETRTVTTTTYLLNDGGSCPSGYTAVNCSEGGASCPSPCGTSGFVCCRLTTSTTEYRCTDSQRLLYGCSDTQQTVTTFNHFLRIISSVGGVVSTATGDVSLSSAAAAVKVVTSSNTVTAFAYSDSAMTNQIGTSTVTPSSPNRGTSTGLVKAPSTVSQGSTADNFSTSV